MKVRNALRETLNRSVISESYNRGMRNWNEVREKYCEDRDMQTDNDKSDKRKLGYRYANFER